MKQNSEVILTRFKDVAGKIGQMDTAVDLRGIDHSIGDRKIAEGVIDGRLYSASLSLS